MSFSVPECFMAAFAAGLAFALVYELLRIVRLILPLKAVTFVCDILFFLLAALAVTRLSVSLGNYVRWSTVFGFGAGVFTYVNTLGRLLNILENAIAHAVRSALSGLFRMLGNSCAKFFRAIAHRASGVFGEISKNCSNNVKKLSGHLKKPPKIVYNKESRKDNSGGSETGHVIKAQVRRGVNS